MTAKTDNHNPAAKLELRRYFLRKYHADKPPDVLDCCQGGGLLWRELRKEFAVSSYWGLDLKPKKGRLKLDSVCVLQQPGWPQNVVDVDTYGSPWKHWEALLPQIRRPTTVFLTRGSHSREPLCQYEKTAIGMTLHAHIPEAFWPKLTLMDFAISYCVATPCAGIILVEAVEAVSDGNARYVGVHLRPQEAASADAVTPAEPKHPLAVLEQTHV